MLTGICSWPVKVIALVSAALLLSAAAAPATDYNITLVTDSTPDLTDIGSYLRSITAQYTTPEEQAIAIWRWSQRLRKQTSNAMEDGHFVLDPILLFNSYGHCNCGIISGLNNALWLNLGWKAHYVQLGDHTVSECSWDGGQTWHMFDASMSFYCFNDHGHVASVREIEKNPRFYLENSALTRLTAPTTSAVGGVRLMDRSGISEPWPTAMIPSSLRTISPMARSTPSGDTALS